MHKDCLGVGASGAFLRAVKLLQSTHSLSRISLLEAIFMPQSGATTTLALPVPRTKLAGCRPGYG